MDKYVNLKEIESTALLMGTMGLTASGCVGLSVALACTIMGTDLALGLALGSVSMATLGIGALLSYKTINSINKTNQNFK